LKEKSVLKNINSYKYKINSVFISEKYIAIEICVAPSLRVEEGRKRRYQHIKGVMKEVELGHFPLVKGDGSKEYDYDYSINGLEEKQAKDLSSILGREEAIYLRIIR